MSLLSSLKEAAEASVLLLKNCTEAESVLDRITLKLEKLNMTLQDFKNLLKSIDDETTRIGARIQELSDKLAAGGLSPEEEKEAFDGLSAAADRLKTIGQMP